MRQITAQNLSFEESLAKVILTWKLSPDQTEMQVVEGSCKLTLPRDLHWLTKLIR